MPIDDNKFSAMNTSENVPSDKTRAKMHPRAKKHITTNQYILDTNDCKSRSFINSYTVSVFIFPDSISGVNIVSDSSVPSPARRDIFHSSQIPIYLIHCV